MFWSTCHNLAGEWTEPKGRCAELVVEHRAGGTQYGSAEGVLVGNQVRDDEVCGQLVCGQCGRCQRNAP